MNDFISLHNIPRNSISNYHNAGANMTAESIIFGTVDNVVSEVQTIDRVTKTVIYLMPAKNRDC